MNSVNYDVIVVGGSFAGLAAAMPLARARRRVLLVDAGRPRNRFSAASHGFLGQDGKAPHDIMHDGVRELLAYASVTFARAAVTSVTPQAAAFEVTLDDGRAEVARRLILATGLRDELPPVPGVQERWGKTVLHCPYCHGYEVRDRALGVLASHPMAVHAATLVSDWGPTTLFTQGAVEPDGDQRARLTARGVRIEPRPVVELLGEAPALEAARLADGTVVPRGALFVAPKVHMASPLAAALGCAFEAGPLGPYLRVDESKQTSVPGVYAAGDAAAAMGNATLAAASGMTAGVGVHQALVADAATPAGARRTPAAH